MLISTMQEYELKVNLHGSVDPAQSKHTILKSKLEVSLHKSPAEHWPQLMADEKKQNTSQTLQPATQQPSYPSSFKR